MITGKTSSGFEFSIADGLDKDFRFLKAYRKMHSGDENKTIEGLEELISVVFSNDDEEERYYRHVASIYGGRIPMDILESEMNEIFESAKQKDENVKNS